MSDKERATRPRRPMGAKHAPVRSVRMPSDRWDPARRRASREGLTMSYVMSALIQMYAQGAVSLPETQRNLQSTDNTTDPDQELTG